MRVQRVQRGRIAAFGGNNYKVSVTGLAFVSLWRPRHFERRYKPVWFHSFMEPVKGSPEISPQKAALRQSVQHRVSFLRLPSYTLSRCAGLRPGGKHVTGFSDRFALLQIQFLCHLKGKRENRWHWILYIVSHMTQTAKPVTFLRPL